MAGGGMSVLTFDLETGTNTLAKRRASPFHPDNYIVAAGFKRDDGVPTGSYYASQQASRDNYAIPFADTDTLLVGFNIKFDLLWSWHREELLEFFKRGGQIWDCQYVEYLLEGQTQFSQMISMDECVERYGGTLKIDAVKELWNRGVDTPDIDPDLLMSYLLGDPEQEIEGDVNNTYLIFQGQAERASKAHPNMMASIARRMDGLLATTEMEYNGIYVNRARAERDRTVIVDRLGVVERELTAFIPELPEALEFNWSSVYHKSALIFGGVVGYDEWRQHTDSQGAPLYCKRTEKWPLFEGAICAPALCRPDPDNSDLFRRISDGATQDIFKSGKRKGEGKTKNVSVDDLERPKGAIGKSTFRFPGYVKPVGIQRSKLKAVDGNNLFKTDTDTLDRVMAENTDVPFIKTMGEAQRLSKMLGTYYWNDVDGVRKGMLTLVGSDGIIHHKLNHNQTVTTRTSSSDPNGQNIPVPTDEMPGPKVAMESRFGSDGVVAEIDYSQLEVVCQGLLSRDKQLLADLEAGVDFHCKRAATALGEEYEDVLLKSKDDTHPEYPTYSGLRRNAKVFSFQRAYGAGPHKIAASTGMPLEEVEALVAAEERMYPGVVAFDKLVEQSIARTKRITKRLAFIAGQTFNIGQGEWWSPSGIRYLWSEHEAPDFLQKKGKFLGFVPTERKNWPIQGEGGFVVQAMIGYLWRWIIQQDHLRGKVFLTNTVHDCVWFDMRKECVDEVLPTARAILEMAPTMYQRLYGRTVPVKFPTDVEVGPNMAELHHYN
jgi:DNA polymerase I-like protein with 3'-5' exonuclease and polymerase domains